MAIIMIVDDSDIIRTQLVDAIKEKGHQVVEAVDGADGLTKAREASHIDIILADVNMPKMDGLAMCKEIRSIDRYKKTPIFILTTETSSTLKSTGKSLGVSFWAVKPVNSANLLKSIEMVLKNAA